MPPRDRSPPAGTGSGGQICAHDVKMELRILGDHWAAMGNDAKAILHEAWLTKELTPWGEKEISDRQVAYRLLEDKYPELASCVGDWACNYIFREKSKTWNRAARRHESKKTAHLRKIRKGKYVRPPGERNKNSPDPSLPPQTAKRHRVRRGPQRIPGMEGGDPDTDSGFVDRDNESDGGIARRPAEKRIQDTAEWRRAQIDPGIGRKRQKPSHQAASDDADLSEPLGEPPQHTPRRRNTPTGRIDTPQNIHTGTPGSMRGGREVSASARQEEADTVKDRQIQKLMRKLKEVENMNLKLRTLVGADDNRNLSRGSSATPDAPFDGYDPPPAPDRPVSGPPDTAAKPPLSSPLKLGPDTRWTKPVCFSEPSKSPQCAEDKRVTDDSSLHREDPIAVDRPEAHSISGKENDLDEQSQGYFDPGDVASNSTDGEQRTSAAEVEQTSSRPATTLAGVPPVSVVNQLSVERC